MKKLFYFIIILIFGACSVTTKEDTTATSSTTLPDYDTTTLSGKIGTDWTFQTGRALVSSSGSYTVYMINDNLSNACSSSYSYTASNPLVYFSRDNLTVGETELGWGTGYGSVSFLDGSTSYLITKGKISIDTHTTTEVTGKMYAIFGTDTDHEINGTFTLSRCCTSGSSYALCE